MARRKRLEPSMALAELRRAAVAAFGEERADALFHTLTRDIEATALVTQQARFKAHVEDAARRVNAGGDPDDAANGIYDEWGAALIDYMLENSGAWLALPEPEFFWNQSTHERLVAAIRYTQGEV